MKAILAALLLLAPAAMAGDAGRALAELLAGPDGRVLRTERGWRTQSADIARTDSGYLVRMADGSSFTARRIPEGLRLPVFDLVRTERGWRAGETELLRTDRGLRHRGATGGDAARTYFDHFDR